MTDFACCRDYLARIRELDAEGTELPSPELIPGWYERYKEACQAYRRHPEERHGKEADDD